MAPLSYRPDIVFITGATGDFGRAFARRFGAAGSRLVLHGRNADKLADLTRELKAPVHTVLFDVSDRPAMNRAMETLPPEFSAIDLLVNNAGGAFGLDKFHEGSQDDFDAMITANVSSLVALTRLVLPGMAARQRGHVINIGSVAGRYPYPGGHVYCASKAFVRQFSLSIRADLQGANVRVTDIEPGMVQTQFSLARFKGDKTRADAVYANTTPLTADDIAETVFWAATLPPHVNINTLEVMPTAQSFSPLAVERKTGA